LELHKFVRDFLLCEREENGCLSNTAFVWQLPTCCFSPINSMKNEKPLVLESNNPPSYMLQEPLIQAVRVFGLLSALKNKSE